MINSFKNFVCWNPSQVSRVMDPEALYTSPQVFLATHHPIKMQRQEAKSVGSIIGYDVADERYTEEKFLKDFLDQGVDFKFVPVLGHAGTGKSHLIRWLYFNIPRSEKRRVLLIPKSNTNLKDIIKSMLDLPGIEDSKFDKYKSELDLVGTDLDDQQIRNVLLDNLATLVGPNRQRDANELSREQQFLVRSLPDFLRDPYFRKEFLKDGGLIHSLVDHIVGNVKTVERLEQRRGFTESDIPLNLTEETQASKSAQSFYGAYRVRPQVIRSIIDWLNQHLDEAITMVLRFSREDLQRLMRDVRETLAEQGVELVLLIEDFAKLQGIDRQVLEAVLVRPQQIPGKELCSLRTALACTTGYFESLMDTVQQRTSFVVNLDAGEVSENSLVTIKDLETFVSRYLNAARVPESVLEKAFQGDSLSAADEKVEVPNHCVDCPYREPCHSSFGSAGGIGLYPFNGTALEKMLQRKTGGKFNPRLLIKHILMKPLEDYASALQAGNFPPPALAKAFDGPKFPARLQMELEKLDSVNHSRREVLLDLWSAEAKIQNLNSGIHQAFDLPLLEEVFEGEEVVSVEDENQEGVTIAAASAVAAKTAVIPSELEQMLHSLDEWGNGAQFPQALAQKLRVYIYDAVRQRIEWDSEMLLPTQFAGASRPFQQRNVNFERGYNNNVTSGVELFIMATRATRKDNVVALQALLKYQNYKNWDYPGGVEDLRIYARELQNWSQSVVNQIRNPRQNGEFWDPIPATVELLALGARMANRPAASNTTLSDRVNALFESVSGTDTSTRTKAWRQLFEAFIKNREKMVEILLSRIPCTKGGHSTLQMIDVSQMVDSMQKVSSLGRPKCVIPIDLRKEFEPLLKFRAKVEELFEPAISEEKEKHVNWYETVTKELGEDGSAKQVLEVLEDSLKKAKEAGCFAGVNDQELESTIESFKYANVDHCLKLVRKIIPETEESTLLLELSRIPQATMITVNNFLNKVTRFLDSSLEKAQGDVADLLNEGGQDLESSKRLIDESLNRLIRIVEESKRGFE